METVVDGAERRSRLRATIVEVAALLLEQHGPSAVTTRGVADAAGVQPPTIYRLFGDKDGLLDAVAEHVMTAYVSSKAAVLEAARADDTDPLTDLRAGWQTHIGFALANPALFRLLSLPDRRSPAAAEGAALLRDRVHRVALAGRLRVSEARAAAMLHAAGTGAVLTLLALPPAERDPGLTDAMYDAVVHAVTTGSAPPAGDPTTGAAVTLRAGVARTTALSEAERMLLADWLDRIVDAEAT